MFKNTKLVLSTLILSVIFSICIFANSFTIHPGIYYQTNCTTNWSDYDSNGSLVHGTDYSGEDLNTYIVITEDNGTLKFQWQNEYPHFKMTGSFTRNGDGSYSVFNNTDDPTNDYLNATIYSITPLSDTEIMIFTYGDGGGYAESYITMKMQSQNELTASTSDWKSSYIDYIVKHGNIYDRWGDPKYTYKLVNINNDGIPELYINFGSTAEGDVICTNYNGVVIEQPLWNYGLSYIESQNLIRNAGGHMDDYYDELFTIHNGQFLLLHTGKYGAPDNSQLTFDSDGNPIYNYYWDGIKITSETEYNTILNQSFNTQLAVSPFDGAEYNKTSGRYVGNGLCIYDEIIAAINAY